MLRQQWIGVGCTVEGIKQILRRAPRADRGHHLRTGRSTHRDIRTTNIPVQRPLDLAQRHRRPGKAQRATATDHQSASNGHGRER